MPTNVDPTPAQGDFCDDSNHPMKPHILERYNQHMRYVDNSDHMIKNYLMSRQTFKWTKILCFHLLDITVIFMYITPVISGSSGEEFD
jgi:hypothetical protein